MKNSTSINLADTVEAIRANHRERKFMMAVRKKIDNSIKAYLRVQLGFRIDMTKAERDAIASRVLATIKVAEAAHAEGWADFESEDELFNANATLLEATFMSRLPFDAVEADSLKSMRSLVRKLPVWTGWAKDVKGVGENTVGSIIGECGDLSIYATDAKLNKRMGLAVIDGVRQGGLLKTAKAEDWVKHGYSGQRRSILYNFSDSMIKAGGPYRALYDTQKAREIEKAEARGLTVLPALDIAKLVKKGADGKKYMSAGHIHRRACRWVEKRFLRHLWREWNAQSEANPAVPEKARVRLPEAA